MFQKMKKFQTMACVAMLTSAIAFTGCKSNDDVERYLGLSTLALVPLTTEDTDKKKSKKSDKKKK